MIGGCCRLLLLFYYFIQTASSTEVNEVRCTSDDDCGTGERCDKLCSWTHSHAKHIGCILICIEEQFATSRSAFSHHYRRGAYDDDNGVAKAVNYTEWIESSTDQSVNYEDDDNSTIISIVSSEDTHKGYGDEYQSYLPLQTLDLESPENATTMLIDSNATVETVPLSESNVSSTVSDFVESVTAMEGVLLTTWTSEVPQTNYITAQNYNFTLESETSKQLNNGTSTAEKTFGWMENERSSDVKETSETNETNAVKTINSLSLSAVQSIKEKLAQLERLHTQHYGSYSECPQPGVCGEECGVTIGEDGCQTCQCLWRTADCAEDNDCNDKTQFCDLGKCQCKKGYIQDMQHSGLCIVASDDIIDGSIWKKASRVIDATAQLLKPVAVTEVTQYEPYQMRVIRRRPQLQQRRKMIRDRRRRRRSAKKIEDTERLQWPS